MTIERDEIMRQLRAARAGGSPVPTSPPAGRPGDTPWRCPHCHRWPCSAEDAAQHLEAELVAMMRLTGKTPISEDVALWQLEM
jgi:hypothetical protein